MVKKYLPPRQKFPFTRKITQIIAIGFTNDETRVATNEISHNVAVHDLLSTIFEAVEKHDQETLEYTLQQAQSLEIMDKPEVPLPPQSKTFFPHVSSKLFVFKNRLFKARNCLQG